MSIKKLIPAFIIIALIGLNIFAFQLSKNYFTSTGNNEEVEELSDTEQGEVNDNRLLIWTYEFFKSFRTTPR